jgi:hypothetical protein
MKKKLYLYIFLFSLIFTIGLSSCNSDDNPVIPPDPTVTDPKEDDLLGKWEVYYSDKTVSGFGAYRSPDYDGFTNEFYKENNLYKFKGYDLINLVDEGTYKIEKDELIMDVTKYQGRDTTYQNIEKLSYLSDKKETFIVYKYYTVNGYSVRDNRAMRNMSIAPKTHPDVEKIDIDKNFDRLVGTWEIYDYALLENSKWVEGYSKLQLDSLGGNSYTYGYDSDGDKIVSLKVKVLQKDGSALWYAYNNLKIKIVDDVIYYFIPAYDPETGKIETYAFWLWLNDWQNKTIGNETVDTYIDKNQFRLESNPELYYQEKRYMKKVK